MPTARRRSSRKASASSDIPAPYAGRIEQVRAALKKKGADGLLVWNRMDQYWLTGFTGEDGGVLLTPRKVVLLTDGRFDETADQEAPWAIKVLRKVRSPEETAKQVNKYRIRALGYDPNQLVVSEFTALRRHVRPTRLIAAGGLIAELRRCKDDREVAAIRRAIEVAEKAFQKLCRWIKPGMTEREVAARLIFDMQKLGAQGPSFDPIVAVGATGSLPHYAPGDREINTREGVLIDWGARVDWYISDLTRVIWPGSIPRRLAKVYDIVAEAQRAAIAAIRPGVRTSEIDAIARRHITRAGYGKHFNHAVGHGMGLDVHEGPGMRKTSTDVLEPGMVVTVEPGIYLSGVGGVRLEDDVLVTPDGHEILSSLSLERRSLDRN